MRAAYDNLLKQASSISVTNHDSNYAIENLYDNSLKSILKTTIQTSLITVDFDADVAGSCFAVGNHNIGSVILTFKNSGGGTIGSESYVNDDLIHVNTLGVVTAQGIVYFTSITGIRKIKISITATTADPISIGDLFVGSYLEFPYFNFGAKMPRRITGSGNKTDGGILAGKSGVSLERFQVNFSDVELNDQESLNALLAFTQVNTPMWVDRWEESEEFVVLFCNLIKPEIPYTKVNGRIIFSQITLEFEECK